MSTLLASALVFVAQSGPAVEWHAPAECPDEAKVLEFAEELLGAPLDAEVMQNLELRGGIDRTATGYSLQVEIVTPGGRTTKSLEARRCEFLGSITSLMLSIAVDPLHNVAMRQARPVSPPSQIPTLSDETQPEPAPGRTARAPRSEPTPNHAEPPPRPRELQGFAGVSGSIGAGLLPTFDASAGLGFGLLTRHVRAELSGFHVFARDARYDEQPSVGASVSAWGGALRVGPRVRWSTLEVHALGGVALAALSAEGFGTSTVRTQTELWIAAVVAPGLRWAPIPRLALGLDLEMQAGLLRPAFSLDTLGAVHRAASVGARGVLSAEIRFGGRLF